MKRFIIRSLGVFPMGIDPGDMLDQTDGGGDAELVRMEFAALLRRLLRERRLTQTALAFSLGIGRVGIARMVTKRRAPTAEMCGRIANVLDLTETERYALNLAAARAKGYEV